MRGGICVPGIKMVDAEQGALGLELIDGKAVRHILPGAGDDDDDDDDDAAQQFVGPPSSNDPVDSLQEFGVTHG